MIDNKESEKKFDEHIRAIMNRRRYIVIGDIKDDITVELINRTYRNFITEHNPHTADMRITSIPALLITWEQWEQLMSVLPPRVSFNMLDKRRSTRQRLVEGLGRFVGELCGIHIFLREDQ